MQYILSMKKKLYVETSVWNQIDQEERLDFKEITEKFLSLCREGVYDLYISEIVLWEIDECSDDRKKQALLDLIEAYKPTLLLFNEESQRLRTKYVEAGVLDDKRRNRYYDTAHVAIASVNGFKYVLTFNFVHLLKIARIEMFNGVNLLNGYDSIQLVSPELFIPEEKE